MPQKFEWTDKGLQPIKSCPIQRQFCKDVHEHHREHKKAIKKLADSRNGKPGGIYQKTDDEIRTDRDNQLKAMITETALAPGRERVEIFTSGYKPKVKRQTLTLKASNAR